MNSFLGLTTAFLCLLLAKPCQAQYKYEREYKIKPGAVPPKASQFINDVFSGTKIHWYGEESLTGKTIEAKLKSKGQQYSIEFNPAGEVQDVEIQSSYNQLAAATRKAIADQLSRKFDKFTVIKTQRQWTASQRDLKNSLLTDKVAPSVRIRYELILKASKNRSANYYEVLCEQDGAIVSIHQLVQRNAANLIY